MEIVINASNCWNEWKYTVCKLYKNCLKVGMLNYKQFNIPSENILNRILNAITLKIKFYAACIWNLCSFSFY